MININEKLNENKEHLFNLILVILKDIKDTSNLRYNLNTFCAVCYNFRNKVRVVQNVKKHIVLMNVSLTWNI